MRRRRKSRKEDGCLVVFLQLVGSMAFVFGLGSAFYLVSLHPGLGVLIGVCALTVYGCFRVIERDD